MTINELVNSIDITLENALILASISIFAIVGIRIIETFLFGIRDIILDILSISENRKKAKIVKNKEVDNNG